MPTASKKTPFSKFIRKQKKRLDQFMARRPHRSFRLTRRRDYVQHLALPGLFSFTAEVTKTLWRNKRIFLALGGIYAALYAILVGAQSQENYSALTETLKQASESIAEGGIGVLGEASVLLFSLTTSNLGGELTEAQQIFALLLLLLVWLTTVWLLRNILAGHKVKLRDGIYAAGAPLFATVLIALLIAAQLLPVALATVGYNAAFATGLLDSGVAAMLFWIAAGLLSVLSLYWVTSSLFALIIITIPGMYPYAAIRTAGDLMVGRRLKILVRWVWMGFVMVVAAFIALIPFILMDRALKLVWPALEWVPIVPVAMLIFTTYATIWAAGYVYLLYRKVVDDVSAK